MLRACRISTRLDFCCCGATIWAEPLPPICQPGCLRAFLPFVFRLEIFGDVSAKTLRKARRAAEGAHSELSPTLFANRTPATRDGIDLKPGALLAREWKGKLERVTVLDDGFAWNGKTYGSLSKVAKAMTGTSWNGHRFFGLRSGALRQVSEGNKGVIRSKISMSARPTSEAAS